MLRNSFVRSTIAGVASCALIAVGVAGCGDDDDTDVAPTPTEEVVVGVDANVEIPTPLPAFPSDDRDDRGLLDPMTEPTIVVPERTPEPLDMPSECDDGVESTDCITALVTIQAPLLFERDPDVGECVAEAWIDSLGTEVAARIASDPYWFDGISDGDEARTAFTGLRDCSNVEDMVTQQIVDAGQQDGLPQADSEELPDCVTKFLEESSPTLLEDLLVEVMVESVTDPTAREMDVAELEEGGLYSDDGLSQAFSAMLWCSMAIDAGEYDGTVPETTQHQRPEDAGPDK